MPREVGAGRLPPWARSAWAGNGTGWGAELVGLGCPWACGLLGLAPLGCEVGGRRGHTLAGWAPFGFQLCGLA